MLYYPIITIAVAKTNRLYDDVVVKLPIIIQVWTVCDVSINSEGWCSQSLRKYVNHNDFRPVFES